MKVTIMHISLTEFQEMKDLILSINKTKELINKEINKLPTEFIKNHLQKVYILGDDFLDYPKNTKNGIYRTHDAIIIQRPFLFFSYKCYIKWGCAFRKDTFKTDDIRLYNQNIILSNLDKDALKKLNSVLTSVLTNILKMEVSE